MLTFVMLVLLEIVLWLLLAALYAVHLTPSGISNFELERRSQAGDEQATFLRRRNAALADVAALRFGGQTLLSAVLIAVAFAAGGWLGLLVAVIALVLVKAAARLPLLARTSQTWYEEHEMSLIGLAERWRALLAALRDSHGSSGGQFVYSKEELVERLKTTRGIVSKEELLYLQHSLFFSSKTVREVMTPRSVIDAIGADEALGPVTLDRLHHSGHSRFPVYVGDIDHIAGTLYLHDLVPLKKDIKQARDAMHNEVFYIRDDYSLEWALAAFLRTRHHLLIVVNEYQETVGLLSLEDVIETLVGRRIVDEFDRHDDLRAVARRNPRGNNSPKQRRDV